MNGILLGAGFFSWLVIIWALISIALVIIFYKRLSKHTLIFLGTFLGGIIFTLGLMGFSSGLGSMLRTIAVTKTSSIENLLTNGIQKAKFPFSLATIVTVIYFAVLSIFVIVKKEFVKKWSLWIGWFIFIILTVVPAMTKYSLNTKLLSGVGKILGGENNTIGQLKPLLKAERFTIYISILLSIAYLLITILVTLYKRVKKEPHPDT